MTLGEWLKRTKTTQAALAERCGVHPITITKWKTGTMTPRPSQLDALTRATGGAVTANDFQASRGLAETQASLGGPEALAAKAARDAAGWERARRWAEENRAAIEAHNRYVEEHGVPLAEYRMF